MSGRSHFQRKPVLPGGRSEYYQSSQQLHPAEKCPGLAWLLYQYHVEFQPVVDSKFVRGQHKKKLGTDQPVFDGMILDLSFKIHGTTAKDPNAMVCTHTDLGKKGGRGIFGRIGEKVRQSPSGHCRGHRRHSERTVSHKHTPLRLPAPHESVHSVCGCRYDFFMIPQCVRQGTVTPVSYNVIYDRSGLKADHLQKLAYKLCHLYYNWQGTIRVPAPCQYAHKLAFLVAQSLHEPAKGDLGDKLFFL